MTCSVSHHFPRLLWPHVALVDPCLLDSTFLFSSRAPLLQPFLRYCSSGSSILGHLLFQQGDLCTPVHTSSGTIYLLMTSKFLPLPHVHEATETSHRPLNISQLKSSLLPSPGYTLNNPRCWTWLSLLALKFWFCSGIIGAGLLQCPPSVSGPPALLPGNTCFSLCCLKLSKASHGPKPMI